MRINILSGDAMVSYAQQLGIKDHIIAFGEAIITGRVSGEPMSNEFINARVASLNTSADKYRKRISQPLSKLRSNDDVHLWFGKDMFCQMNLVCVLAVLESKGIEKATFHEVFEDEMAEKSVSEIQTHGFIQCYNEILVNHNSFITPQDSINNVLEMYFEFINADKGPLISFIKENPDDSVLTLTVKIIKAYAEYGLGDVQCKDLILRVRA